MKTGDIGYVDEKGFVYVVDRKKDVFKYKGHHINPSDIENMLQSIDGVEFAVVVGIPNATTYNLITAVIKKKSECENLHEQDVVEWAKENLPPYKQLCGGVYFVDNLPMTASGKVLRREVRDIATKLYNQKIV